MRPYVVVEHAERELSVERGSLRSGAAEGEQTLDAEEEFFAARGERGEHEAVLV